MRHSRSIYQSRSIAIASRTRHGRWRIGIKRITEDNICKHGELEIKKEPKGNQTKKTRHQYNLHICSKMFSYVLMLTVAGTHLQHSPGPGAT